MTEKIRDHLANERTFLAWIRTALGMMGLGFVLARMGLFLQEISGRAAPPTTPTRDGSSVAPEFLIAGAVFLLLGAVMTPWAWWDYRAKLRAIEHERFEPARGSILLLAGLICLGSLAIVGLVIAEMLLAWR